MPGPGFAAGPCLFKDTMQLAAFSNNSFILGHSAMLVNEGLPLYVVDRVAERFALQDLTVGILGMAFKGESDDIRSSLSYKLRRILRFKAREVLCTDPYVSTDPSLLRLDEVLAGSDVLILGAPHHEYAGLVTDKPVARCLEPPRRRRPDVSPDASIVIPAFNEDDAIIRCIERITAAVRCSTRDPRHRRLPGGHDVAPR